MPVTVMLNVPPVVTSEAGIVTVSWALLTKLVVRFDPLHLTTELPAKFAPLTMSVNAPLPTATEAGLRLVIRGTAPTAAAASTSASATDRGIARAAARKSPRGVLKDLLHLRGRQCWGHGQNQRRDADNMRRCHASAHVISIGVARRHCRSGVDCREHAITRTRVAARRADFHNRTRAYYKRRDCQCGLWLPR